MVDRKFMLFIGIALMLYGIVGLLAPTSFTFASGIVIVTLVLIFFSTKLQHKRDIHGLARSCSAN